MLEWRHRPGGKLPRQSCDESRPARPDKLLIRPDEGGQAGAGSTGDRSLARHATRRSGMQGVTRRHQHQPWPVPAGMPGTDMPRLTGMRSWYQRIALSAPESASHGADATLLRTKFPASTRILRWQAMIRWARYVPPETQPARWLGMCPTLGRLWADSTESSEYRPFSGARERRHLPQAFQRRRGPCCERSLFLQRSSALSRCPRPVAPGPPRQSSHCRTTRPNVGVSHLVHPLQCLPSSVKRNAVHRMVQDEIMIRQAWPPHWWG